MLLANPNLLFPAFLLAGLLMGWLLHRSDFCISGILRDVFMFRDYTQLPPLLLVVAAGMLLFQLARMAGILPFDPPPTYGSEVSLLALGGGLLFGIGMVLAGGCVVGTLYKLGSGNLTSLLAFLGMLVGSMIYAEIYPAVAELRQATVLTDRPTLVQAWPEGGLLAGWGLVALAAIPLVLWWRQGRITINSPAAGFIQPWRVALILVALNLLIYLLAGWPFSISTAYTKIAAFLELLVAPGHVAQLAYFQQDSRVIETTGGRLTGGPGPRIDLIFISEIPLLLGIMLGALASALALKEFHLGPWPPRRQGMAAFAGGALVLLGARLAGGCNLKFILGGLPLLSFQAMLFAAGLVAGAWLGALLLPRIILR
ncbi:YeeE/YedE thiosulfate transporter family protein [Desulfurivibrio dismutans]|uniref:YeeE/YedE thiosulfate transporter family protein n=1 Tax=Desulfurivibrio dismutans TaxID=1398908 RepID=UPI0023DAB7D5|nr:YeeE/YedE thiosulfate transporter family protein [Desulfurivibrio alkaliphilus]MDF1614333.1 YeeE/YedE thiosulfate transporter family protein [Desulfurivibrio alkaliphilus]